MGKVITKDAFIGPASAAYRRFSSQKTYRDFLHSLAVDPSGAYLEAKGHQGTSQHVEEMHRDLGVAFFQLAFDIDFESGMELESAQEILRILAENQVILPQLTQQNSEVILVQYFLSAFGKIASAAERAVAVH